MKPKNAKDLAGKRFGRLVVLKDSEQRDSNGYILWLCKCDCGNEKLVPSRYLGRGTSSCGCYAREQSAKRSTKHGKCHSRVYHIYRTMLQRCHNPNAHEFDNYGGRGIAVCDEWKDFKAFYEWAISNGYEERLTLDRVNPNGNYEPNNCRWVSMKKQQRNRRNNVLLTYKGETHCVSEWAEIIGIQAQTIRKRLKAGWGVEDALGKPLA